MSAVGAGMRVMDVVRPSLRSRGLRETIMNQWCRSLVCAVGMLACMVVGVHAQTPALIVGDVTGTEVTVPITMTSEQDVQGYVLSVAYDASAVTAVDVRAAGATLAGNAELIVGEILAGGFTLGVVMDFEAPYDGQVIPAINVRGM